VRKLNRLKFSFNLSLKLQLKTFNSPRDFSVSGGEFPAATKPDAGFYCRSLFPMAHGFCFVSSVPQLTNAKLHTTTGRGKTYS
jgi:hypothetical protein